MKGKLVMSQAQPGDILPDNSSPPLISSTNQPNNSNKNFGWKLIVGIVCICAVALYYLVIVPKIKSTERKLVRFQFMKIGMALVGYVDKNKCFPPAVLLGPDAKTPHSWRVALLPYLDESYNGVELYKQYNLDEPWDSPNNLKVLAKMPDVYRIPSQSVPDDHTHLQMIVGSGTWQNMIPTKSNQGPPLAHFFPVVVETKPAVPWTKPDDLTMSDELPQQLGVLLEGVFFATMSDATVDSFTREIPLEVLKESLKMKNKRADLEKYEK
jgi:hypothetical protein